MSNEIKKYTFREGLPQEFELVDLKNLFDCQRNTITTIHRVNFYHIIWFQQGSPVHLVDFKQLKIKPNTILFLNKNVVHQFDKRGNFGGKAILFTDKFFCKTQADTKFLQSTFLFNELLSLSQIHFEDNTTPFEELFLLIEREFEKNGVVNQSDILKNLLHSLLLYSERERRNQDFVSIAKSVELEYVILFKDLLEKHFNTQKQVNQYAIKLAITTKRLNQATTKILGMSPKQLIDERVILEAKRLLAYSNESVKEIGYELGFDEPTNFIKFFRRYGNCTPIEFREMQFQD